MLIVKPSNIDETGRINCELLQSKLAHFLKDCENHINYAISPAIWTKDQRSVIVGEAIQPEMSKMASEKLQYRQLRIHHGPSTLRKAVSESSAVTTATKSLLMEMVSAQVLD